MDLQRQYIYEQTIKKTCTDSLPLTKKGRFVFLVVLFPRYCKQIVQEKFEVIRKCTMVKRKGTNMINCELMLTYDTPALRQAGSRNLTGPKTLPTIWYTYMTLVTKYQISAINSDWEKCDEKYLGRTEGRTEVKQYTPLPLRGAGI